MTHPPAVKDDCGLCKSDAVQVRGHRGVAFHVLGHPVELHDGLCYFDGDCEGDTDTSRVVAVMVGDDEPLAMEANECSPLAREAFCGDCGQVGCTHDGLERTEGRDGRL